ncbi:AraC-type DNA-binding protein [Fodinibius roseus]|uniref:AraC-type DNA-binding protein n=1 Tax=Fodinibius roseus TaxID=1194090 RepID=A0A1M5INR4_9BACT|nr:AraC family transcriptional regulator [Fodinibius roseus]SHG29590.1 AraC-type DNA-binding protein [Fodinibius roseus]
MIKEVKRIRQVLETYRNELSTSVPEEQFDVHRAAVYLHEHLFHPDCHVSGMREACKIPQRNFSTRFRLSMGLPPASYITSHRIEAAKRLLSDNQLKDVSISEIGFAVGYERISAFTTLFTKKIGLPPGAWRNQELEKQRRN